VTEEQAKAVISTGTVATGGSLAVLGLVVTNLNSVAPFIDKIGLVPTIAIGCLVFGAAVILLVLKWLSTHGAETAKSLRENSTQQTLILSEMRNTQMEHGHQLKDHGDKIGDIHRAVECLAKPVRPA
jgi:hypothetical protein